MKGRFKVIQSTVGLRLYNDISRCHLKFLGINQR